MFIKKSKLVSIVKKWKITDDVEERLLRKITWLYGVRTASVPEVKTAIHFWTSDDNVHVVGLNNTYNVLDLSGPHFGVPYEVDSAMKIKYNTNNKKYIVTERFGVALSHQGQLTSWGLELSSRQYENPDRIFLERSSGLADDRYDDVFCGGYSIICINDDGIWLKGWLDPAPHKTAYAYHYDYFRLTIKEGVIIKSISCGAYHVAMLDQYGSVWTFGYGLAGQLGYNWSSGDGYDNPLKVLLPQPCIKVECGSYSTLFLLENGEVYACGRNSKYDGLCVGRTGYVFKPVKVLFDSAIADIAASYLDESGKWPSRFGAVSRDHKKYFLWGENHQAQSPTWQEGIDNLFDLFVNFHTPQSLGNLDHEEPATAAQREAQVSSQVGLLPASILDKWAILRAIPDFLRPRVRAFTTFGTGSYHQLLGGFVVTDEDELYGIGLNDTKSLGVVGDASGGQFTYSPIEIRVLGWKKIKRILFNMMNGLALTSNGYVFIWELGRGPEILESMQDKEIVDVSAGARFFLFLDGDAKVYFVGTMSSEYSDEDSKEIVLPDEEQAKQIASGEWHGAILTDRSNVYTFGHGIYNQLGYTWNLENSPYVARKVSLPGPCKKIACGVCSTLFILENGELYACGLNKYADVLGVGHGDTVVVPEKVRIDEPVSDIAVTIRNASFGARVSSFAVQAASGKIFKWGSDEYLPKVLEGVTTLVEAFANHEIPSSLSMVRVAPPVQPKPESNEDIDELNEVSDEELLKVKVGGIPYSDFGDPLFSDITIKLTDGTVAAHKYFLQPKSTFFNNAILKAEAEGKSSIDLKQYNPNAIRALLKHLYSRPVSTEISSLPDCLDLNDLAMIDGNAALMARAEQLFDVLISYKLLNVHVDKIAQLTL